MIILIYTVTGAIPLAISNFGAGTGLIALTQVRCNGTEEGLAHCDSAAVVTCYRGHQEDSGVRCQARTGDQISRAM